MTDSTMNTDNQTTNISSTAASTVFKDTVPVNINSKDTTYIQHHLDTQGLICPEPVMMLHRAVRKAEAGDLIEVLATDPATARDIPNFCRHLGHTLVNTVESANPEGDSDTHTDTLYRYVIQKKLG